MGLYRRKDSPFWWMWMEGGKPRSTGVPVSGGHPTMDRELRARAQRIYAVAMADLVYVREKIPTTIRAVDLTPPTPLRRSRAGWCYVYFVRTEDQVKIGRALDPRERVRALQTGHAEELTLVASVPAHAALERAIHQRFAHLRTHGEWVPARA